MNQRQKSTTELIFGPSIRMVKSPLMWVAVFVLAAIYNYITCR